MARDGWTGGTWDGLGSPGWWGHSSAGAWWAESPGMEARGPAVLGGDVSIGRCQELEEIGGLVVQGRQVPRSLSLVLLLGPLSASILPSRVPPTHAQALGGCAMLKKVHSPWEDPHPLGRRATLGKVYNPWEGPPPTGKVQDHWEGSQPFGASTATRKVDNPWEISLHPP